VNFRNPACVFCCGAADRFAANVLPIIREIQNSGVSSLRGIVKGANGAWDQDGTGRSMERGAGH
jgi:hypothetical protein